MALNMYHAIQRVPQLLCFLGLTNTFFPVCAFQTISWVLLEHHVRKLGRS